MDNTEALMYVVDLENYKIIYANEKFLKEFGALVDETCYKVLQKDKDSPCEFCPLVQVENPLSFSLGKLFKWENKNSVNNKHYLFNDRIILWTNNKKVLLKTAIDITKQKEVEKQISKLAYYDALTKLPNRVLFKDYLQKAIKRSSRTSEYKALLFIDLDNFKVVNDTFGHSVGDKVLAEVAQRIKSSIRENDIVGRIGGDEFVVLIDTNEKNREHVKNFLIKITKKILYTVKNSYNIVDNCFHISASIGIKLFNDEKLSIHELMIYADDAMYRAKLNGKDSFYFS
jgi:diguanylate cyclase (GGDEF)-like protein